MRLPLICMKCFDEAGKPDHCCYPAILQDNGLYEVTCRKGHKTATCLQQQKFELLFELAANAILDSYYREAVTSFTSAAERFYEFYLRVSAAKQGLSHDILSKAWGKISAQSERQYGAYVFLYTVENHSLPPLLSNNHIQFRNDVVHKGKIPSREETIAYGNAVLDVISPVLTQLKTRDHEHVMTIVQQHIRSTREGLREVLNVSFMSMPTTISISAAHSEHQQNLEEALTTLSKRRARIGW